MGCWYKSRGVFGLSAFLCLKKNSMALGELIRLADEIDAMPLNDTDKERLIIQAADLIRFKEAFPEPLEIIKPFEDRGVVFRVGGQTVSVLFHEHNCRAGEMLEITAPDSLESGQLLWLVFITFSGRECCDEIAGLVAGHPVTQQCSNIYTLDYSTGMLHAI
jgi:hypothetical protein